MKSLLRFILKTTFFAFSPFFAVIDYILTNNTYMQSLKATKKMIDDIFSEETIEEFSKNYRE